jgi:hypothetical protein
MAEELLSGKPSFSATDRPRRVRKIRNFFMVENFYNIQDDERALWLSVVGAAAQLTLRAPCRTGMVSRRTEAKSTCSRPLTLFGPV